MKKLTALALTATAAPLAIGLTAAPAQAAGPCDNAYPPGQFYSLRISPSYALVRPGSSVTLFTRLVRGNMECPGERVGWYTRSRGKAFFVLSRRTTTGPRGLVGQTSVARDDFRWYTDFLSFNRRLAQSPPGLVQTAVRN